MKDRHRKNNQGGADKIFPVPCKEFSHSLQLRSGQEDTPAVPFSYPVKRIKEQGNQYINIEKISNIGGDMRSVFQKKTMLLVQIMHQQRKKGEKQDANRKKLSAVLPFPGRYHPLIHHCPSSPVQEAIPPFCLFFACANLYVYSVKSPSPRMLACEWRQDLLTRPTGGMKRRESVTRSFIFIIS